MQDGHSFVVVKVDGTVVDPFQATGCMVDVLKTVDDVTEPMAGYFRDPHDGLLPFVRYTYPSRHSHDAAVVSFKADSHFSDDPTKGQFMAVMSGLSRVGEEPDVFGADKIIKLWKDRCGVASNIFFP